MAAYVRDTDMKLDDDQVAVRPAGPTVDPRRRAANARALTVNPGDGGGGRYSWADTGLDAEQLREQVVGYQQRYGVATEPLA
jgi:hypothetical protein